MFDHNSTYLWVIIALGLSVPALLAIYVHARAMMARRRLERLK